MNYLTDKRLTFLWSDYLNREKLKFAQILWHRKLKKKSNTEITIYNEIGNDQSEGHLISKESYVNYKVQEKETHKSFPHHTPFLFSSVWSLSRVWLFAIPWTAACLLGGAVFPHVPFLQENRKQKCCQVSFSENPEADRETSVVAIWGRRLSWISCDLGHTSCPPSVRSRA